MDNQNDEGVVLHLIYHAVVADEESPEPPLFSLERTAQKGIFRQPVDSFDNSRAIRLIEAFPTPWRHFA